ncbi:hypothetical protein L9F63_016500 [Diploptera punctata]|uniref:CHK kinase-like domain-containing protein n=1 Tax=Diploptera punctata TaxID=6984 RepID=A0AAD8A0Y2_DIPPU|nr:hypothetical protein L9F63_016500 [Diploptera punctata]
MDAITLFQTDILPVIASENFNSNNYKVLKCDSEFKEKGDDHFTSNTYFINLVIQFEETAPETHAIILKLPPDNVDLQNFIGTDAQFYNEVTIYAETIPAFLEFIRKKCELSYNEYDLFPKCYFSKWENMKGAVVLQDMRSVGFRVCEDRIILDYDHCAVVLKALGRFHAISYAMKKLNSSLFHQLTNKFKETLHTEEIFYKITLSRVVEYFERKKEIDEDTFQRFKDHIKEPLKLFMDLIKPKAPLAVLCHGDFCRNNVLFKYEDGKPCAVKFFDFQMVRYASPVIDISFMCFLNTTSEFRRKHWDEMLFVYHRSLVESLADILGCAVADVEQEYTLEMIRNEFRNYAFFGFMICHFFLPEMVSSPAERLVHFGDVYKSVEDSAIGCAKIGGDSATALVADMVKDMDLMGIF